MNRFEKSDSRHAIAVEEDEVVTAGESSREVEDARLAKPHVGLVDMHQPAPESGLMLLHRRCRRGSRTVIGDHDLERLIRLLG